MITRLIYFAIICYATVLGLTSPYCNWDMLPYVASVVAWQGGNPDMIYGETMAAVKAAIPGWIYDQYVHNPLSAEATSFVQVLPFCQVKPLYNGFVWLGHHLVGLSLPVATWSVSAASFALLGFTLDRWRCRHLPRSAWLLLVVGLGFLGSYPMASLARWSTPDALCTLLLAAAVHAGLFARSAARFALFGWLATLARPDGVLFVGPLTLYFAFFQRPRLPGAGLAFLLFLAASALTVSILAGSYGWERMFVYSFLDKTPTPAVDDLHLTWDGYVSALTGGAALFFGSARVLALLALSGLACVAHYLKTAPDNTFNFHLLLATWATIGGRFLVWPAWGDDRFYYAYFLLILYCSGELAAPYLRALCRLLQDHRRHLRGNAG
jgi:hypothetical protein